MSTKFIQYGDAIDYTPGSDLTAGDVVAVEDLVGVVKNDVKAGELGAIHVAGVFELPKLGGAGDVNLFGQKCAWDIAGEVVKPGAAGAGQIHLGKCVQAAADADTTVLVRLEQ